MTNNATTSNPTKWMNIKHTKVSGVVSVRIMDVTYEPSFIRIMDVARYTMEAQPDGGFVATGPGGDVYEWNAKEAWSV